MGENAIMADDEFISDVKLFFMMIQSFFSFASCFKVCVTVYSLNDIFRIDVSNSVS